MLRSFRLKIALLSVCLSGGILLAFGLFFMSVIRKVGRDRVDSELRALADAQVRIPQPPEHWERFASSIRSLYGEGAGRRVVLRALSRSGGLLYASPEWPAEATDGRLPPLRVDRPPGSPIRLPFPPEPPSPEGPPRIPFGARPARPPRPPPSPLAVGGPAFTTVSTARGDWRIMVMANEETVLAVGMNLDALSAEIRRFRDTFLVCAPIALLLVVGAGWLLAHAALRPVTVIARTGETITARRLDRRIPEAGADAEFKRLIDVVNGMLERLERSFQQAVRFSGDAAHELKTPLAVLQGELEEALREAPEGSDAQRRYSGLLEEVQRLVSIVRKLLLLSQADSGQMRLSLAPFDLSAALHLLEEDIRALAPGLGLAADIAPEVRVMADSELIRQVLHNLISNAIKYNRQDGAIECRLRQEARQAVLLLSNTVNPDVRIDRERIFERFYRADRARNRDVDGSGLGLSLAREIARAHGGDLVLGENRTGWIAFRLTLPSVSTPAS
jgi:two-component system, OmpR family, heavy metal sensor histidine kinase CusS